MNIKMAYGVSLATVTFLYAAVARGATMPIPFAADYAANKFPFTAQARIELSRVGDYYKYAMHSTVYMGFYTWDETYDCSVIRVSGNVLYPLEYVHRDRRNGRRDTHTRFDWDRHAAHTSLGDGSVKTLNGLLHPAWDVMSIQVGLIKDVAAADRHTKLEYAVVDKDEITRHRAKIEGEGRIVVRGYSLQAVKIRVEDTKGANMFWLAADYAWLPVRISTRGVTLDLASSPAQARRETALRASGIPDCKRVPLLRKLNPEKIVTPGSRLSPE